MQINWRQQSILAYLAAKGLTKTYDTLAAEANITPEAKYAGMLEKKWTVSLILQKKIIALESRTNGLHSQQNKTYKAPSSHYAELAGHRGIVTKGDVALMLVAFHPNQSFIASGLRY
jgi:platelet-activating factor acetylhydrolase IB subunit alpha